MTDIHSSPTPLRQEFSDYLTLNRKAERTVHTYMSKGTGQNGKSGLWQDKTEVREIIPGL